MSEKQLQEAEELARRVIAGYFLEDPDEIGRAMREAELLAEAVLHLRGEGGGE